MNKTLITKAKKIAVRVHGNQVDKNNYPYMAHILDVASRVSHLGEPFEIVGLLHDAIEDADPEEFKKEILEEIETSFDEEVIKALAESGCYSLCLAPDSGSEDQVIDMDKRVDLNHVSKCVRILQKYPVDLKINFMMGSPNETHLDIIKTIKDIEDGGEICMEYHSDYFTSRPHLIKV